MKAIGLVTLNKLISQSDLVKALQLIESCENITILKITDSGDEICNSKCIFDQVRDFAFHLQIDCEKIDAKFIKALVLSKVEAYFSISQLKEVLCQMPTDSKIEIEYKEKGFQIKYFYYHETNL